MDRSRGMWPTMVRALSTATAYSSAIIIDQARAAAFEHAAQKGCDRGLIFETWGLCSRATTNPLRRLKEEAYFRGRCLIAEIV